MKQDMRNGLQPGDLEIRRALKIHLASRLGPGDCLIEELGLQRGQARLDLALVNGSLHGFEIKSDRDSLRRLANQIALYDKVVDRATLVVGPKTLKNAARMLPPWWGLILVSVDRSGIRLKSIRKPRANPAKDLRVLVELLWLQDSIELLRLHGLDRGIRSKPRRVVWDRIAEKLNSKIVARFVRDKIKARAAHLALA